MITATIQKKGLGIYDEINMLELSARAEKFIPLGSGFFFATRFDAKASLPKEQPYTDFKGFGYDDVLVRGYNRNVIDGHHFVLNKITVRKKLFSFESDISSILPINQFNTIPAAGYF